MISRNVRLGGILPDQLVLVPLLVLTTPPTHNHTTNRTGEGTFSSPLENKPMRAWFLSDPEQECTAAILQELGACVGPAKEVLATTGMEAAVGETMELSEEHLEAAFADTVKVSLVVWWRVGSMDWCCQHHDPSSNQRLYEGEPEKAARCLESIPDVHYLLPLLPHSLTSTCSPHPPNPSTPPQELGRGHRPQDSQGQKYYAPSRGRL